MLVVPGMGAHRIIRAVPLKATAQYVGGLVITAFFVVLLSFTFSFLGTIFCAALAGMMLGALGTHRWRAIPVSFLFPLTIFMLLKGMRTALGERQVLLVSLACFSIFWLTYALAAALFVFERKRQPSADGLAPVRPVPAPGTEAQRAAQTAATGGAAAPKHNGWLSLEMLQGNWSGEEGAHPRFQNRRIRIQRDGLTLFGVDASGQATVLAQAEVKLCTLSSPQTFQLRKPAIETAADTLVSI
jgi:hypothetical protein